MRPARAPRERLATTASGSHLDAFGVAEWALLACVALVWGSSFLFMEIGLDAFAPGVVTFARLGLGAATLALLPAARQPVDRFDLPRVAILGVVWMAVPLTLFPLAQQHVDSSVA